MIISDGTFKIKMVPGVGGGGGGGGGVSSFLMLSPNLLKSKILCIRSFAEKFVSFWAKNYTPPSFSGCIRMVPVHLVHAGP